MVKDLTLITEPRPGQLAAVCQTLGHANINIDGMSGSDREGGVHILVEDAARARQALEKAGFKIREEREVLIISIKNHPGAVGEVFRRIADAGVNVDFDYVDTRCRLVIGASDLDKARTAL